MWQTDISDLQTHRPAQAALTPRQAKQPPPLQGGPMALAAAGMRAAPPLLALFQAALAVPDPEKRVLDGAGEVETIPAPVNHCRHGRGWYKSP